MGKKSKIINNENIVTESNRVKVGLDLAERMALKYSSRGRVPVDDLLSFLHEKLAIILRKYDTGKSDNFIGYTNKCLQGYCFNYIRDHARLVKVPRRYSEIYLLYMSAIKKHGQISIPKASELLNITTFELNAALEALRVEVNELNNFTESIAASNGYDPVEDEYQYIRDLPPKEKKILEYYYQDKLELEDISMIVHLTVEEVQALLDRMVSDLRDIV